MIFGSWAARYLGEAGPGPHDLDVLVVGRPTRESVYDAADRAQHRLALPVNLVIRTADAWRAAKDPLVSRIQASPLVTVLEPGDAPPRAHSPPTTSWPRGGAEVEQLPAPPRTGAHHRQRG